MARIVTCSVCPASMPADEAFWVNDKPYCDNHVPEEPNPELQCFGCGCDLKDKSRHVRDDYLWCDKCFFEDKAPLFAEYEEED